MAVLQEFVGGAYQALSATAGADMAVNVFAETRRTEGSAKRRWLLGTPGQKPFGSGSGAGCRGNFSQDGLTLTTIGTNIYRVTVATGALTLIGTIADNGEPVSYSSNGQGGDQVAIVGGDQLKIYDITAGTLSAAVALPFTGPVTIVFLDGYFIANQRNSPILWFSNIENGLVWDALDFIARSGTSDNVVGLGVAQNNIWVFGSLTTTLFYDSGDADTPFLPYPGSVVHIGAVTPWAIMRRGDVFTWLAQESTGVPRVVKATGGPNPTTVSTPPIDHWLGQCTTLTSAEALTYTQDGHAWYVLTCPGSPDDIQTYAWDDTEELWSARAGWDSTTGRWTRWRARGCCQVESLILVGDYATAQLSTLDLETYTDGEAVLRWMRRMPYIATEPVWLFLDEFELLAEVGVGLTTGQGVDPLVYLRISRDAGKTWVSAGSARLGALGEYGARAVWRRLGRVRADRLVIEISGSDPVKVALVGLSMKATAGQRRAA